MQSESEDKLAVPYPRSCYSDRHSLVDRFTLADGLREEPKLKHCRSRRISQHVDQQVDRTSVRGYLSVCGCHSHLRYKWNSVSILLLCCMELLGISKRWCSSWCHTLHFVYLILAWFIYLFHWFTLCVTIFNSGLELPATALVGAIWVNALQALLMLQPQKPQYLSGKYIIH